MTLFQVWNIELSMPCSEISCSCNIASVALAQCREIGYCIAIHGFIFDSILVRSMQLGDQRAGVKLSWIFNILQIGRAITAETYTITGRRL